MTIEITNRAVDGKSLVLTPSTDANQQVLWACSGPDIADVNLPASCQGGGEKAFGGLV